MSDLPVSIYLNDEYGVVIKCADKSLADELDDFLTKNYYVLYEYNFSEDGFTLFHFGEASWFSAPLGPPQKPLRCLVCPQDRLMFLPNRHFRHPWRSDAKATRPWTILSGTKLNSRRLARRAKGRMPEVSR